MLIKKPFKKGCGQNHAAIYVPAAGGGGAYTLSGSGAWEALAVAIKGA
jgi:hypothetical protein